MTFKKDKYKMIPIDQLIKPPTYEGDFAAYRDRYWATKDGCLLFYGGNGRYQSWSPQCNRNKDVVESLTKSGRCHETCEVVFLPMVYIPIRWTSDSNEIDLDMFVEVTP